MPRIGARPASVMRPAGLARGVAGYGAAWVGGCVIAVLTGASAVVILLTVGAVAAVAALLSAPFALRGSQVHEVRTATVATAGDDLVWTVRATVRRPVHAVVSVDGREVAKGWLADGRTQLEGHAPRRGVHHEATVAWSSAGRLGMVWWRRTATFEFGTLHSGPAPAERPSPAMRMPDELVGVVSQSARVGHDEVDGVRQWRDGDEITAVHWPSTVRLGEFVVRERRRDQAEHWVVTARSGTGDPDGEAARVRRALDDCMSRGSAASVRVDDGPAEELSSAAAVVQWCAAFEDHHGPDPVAPFWRRDLRGRTGPEPDTTLEPIARWVVAAASALPLVMLLQPLGYGAPEVAVTVAAAAAAAFVTTYRPPVRAWLRQLAGLIAGGAVALALIDISAVVGVMTAMRYVMPQLLVALCIMQGFECTDRRGARVTLACSALLMFYAAGVRVDGALGAYLLVGALLLAAASAVITHPDRRRRRAHDTTADGDPARDDRRARRVGVQVAAVLVSVAAVAAILAVIPVPKGPAQLNLPSWLSDHRPTELPGELAAPDGSALLGGALQGSSSRNGGGAGGYPGFSTVMNTALRGDLGDAVVLRVRAPAPDFWRGQTFSAFDGTKWFLDPVTDPPFSEGNDHEIPPADGDIDTDGQTPDYIQTYYVEQDLPNILFAATQPMRVLVEGTVYHRPDGALRADFVLPKGSAYTVLSWRPSPTADALRAESLEGWRVPQKYLELPHSTTERTKELARALADGSPSNYDTVLRIEAWMGRNTGYDLDAPVPPDGADAVDHFLFESQRGFCEQIASATAIMLRSVGIPARIATGYVPSERDEIAGVWISRARDAHAWVEVWFPSFGWVAFDPTASVPLAGESDATSIGGELATALLGLIGDHIGLILGVGFGAVALTVASRAIVAWWRRRRRGRWGVLQDRFVAAAVARGASPNAPNADLADTFDDEDAAAVARLLDECAFSPGWTDTDPAFERAATVIEVLERA